MGERSLEALDVAWARKAPARVLRGSVLTGLLGPAIDFHTRRTVVGHEHYEPAGDETTPAERTTELAGTTAP